jgi:hypothetical protein
MFMKFIYSYVIGVLLIAAGGFSLPTQPSYTIGTTPPDYQAMIIASPGFKVILAGAAVILITAPINLYYYIRYRATVVPEPILPLRSAIRKTVTFPPITVGGPVPTATISLEPDPEPIVEHKGPAITYMRFPRDL